jgi:hypothetical protein
MIPLTAFYTLMCKVLVVTDASGLGALHIFTIFFKYDGTPIKSARRKIL